MACLVCRAAAVVEVLDVGAHPVASFFRPSADAAEQAHRLRLGQCQSCAILQLAPPIPCEVLTPPYDWIFAREPEEHLDAVVEALAALPGIGPDSVVGGLTFKDDTTLERLARRGLSTWRVDPAEDLGAHNPAAGVEVVQRLTTPAAMREVKARRGGADLLVVRHIVEHAEDPLAFLDGCAELLNPGGYLVLEAPDCTRSLQLRDYAMVWEEHSLYLTPTAIARLVRTAGWEVVSNEAHPFPFENSLVLVARRGEPGRADAPQPDELELGRTYGEDFAAVTADLRRRLETARTRGPIALFGAGHLAAAFANFHGLADLIDFVADDTPQKQGLYLPGTTLPILPSGELTARGVKLCLLAVSPQSEANVIRRNAEFEAGGGEFASILAGSERSIRRGVNIISRQGAPRAHERAEGA